MVRKKPDTFRKTFNACGVYVFVMTPMKTTRNRQGKHEIDLEGVEKNIRYFSGVKGEKTMVLCGGSGEFYALSPAEVKAVAKAAVAGAEGRCKIVSGIGGPTKTAVKMAEAAQDVGCDAVLVMPHDPVVKRGEKAIWDHHRAIARAIDIGFLPFRAPHQPLSIDLVKRFARVKNVVAIKEESGAVAWVRTGCRATAGTVPFITGGGENMVPYYYLAGAVGFTTGMANLSLSMSIKLHNAAIQGRWQEAMRFRDYFEPLTEMRRQLGTPMLKAGLEMMGLAGGPVRDTRVLYAPSAGGNVLNAASRRRLRRFLKAKGVL